MFHPLFAKLQKLRMIGVSREKYCIAKEDADMMFPFQLRPSVPARSTLGLAGRFGLMLTLASILGGCATYQNLPETALVPKQSMPTDRVDQAWTLPEASRFALTHNPTLQASRTQLLLARQQAGLAKVPPPLSLGFTFDHPWQQGLFNAFSLSASEDLSFWLQHAPRDDAIRAKLRQAILNQRWQAWQLAAAVQQQYLNLWFAQKQSALIERQIAWAKQRLKADDRARRAGLITADARALTLANLNQWRQMAATQRLQMIKDKATFNGLLGVPADAPVMLTPPPPIDLPPDALTPSLILQRPDLLALKAAIDEQDAHYRMALIKQFPSISLGLTRAQDTSKVQTIGLGINLVIPVFDGNRHAIAVAKTSRALAADHYRNRLIQVRNDFSALEQKKIALKRAAAQFQKDLPQLRAELKTDEQAMSQGLINANTVDTLRQAVFNQQLALLQNQAEQMRAEYALPALIGIAPEALNQMSASSMPASAKPTSK